MPILDHKRDMIKTIESTNIQEAVQKIQSLDIPGLILKCDGKIPLQHLRHLLPELIEEIPGILSDPGLWDCSLDYSPEYLYCQFRFF